MVKSNSRVIIIGGGLGGLSAAIRLQHAGFQTTLLEKNEVVGGKLHEVRLGSYRFDFGPNIITMPNVFKSVISQLGENPDTYFKFIKLEKHTKNSFYDGSHLYFSSNIDEMKEHLFTIDPSSADNYDQYLLKVGEFFLLAQKHFLHRSFSSWKKFMNLPLIKAMSSVKPFQSMDKFHQQFFRDERVRMAFNKYATYIGSSPYTAPASFGLMGHLELGDGVYFTKGGNYEIVKGFERAAKNLGVEIVTKCEVKRAITTGGVIKRVETENGDVYEGDVFVLNGDLLTQYPRLVEERDRKSFTDKKISKLPPSSSAFVILAGVKTRFDLHHHQFFFSKDPVNEFRKLFDDHTYSDDISIYISTSSKTSQEMSPDGDNLNILVNAPPLSERDPHISKEVMCERVFHLLKGRGLDMKPYLQQLKVIDPQTIEKQFHAFHGSIAGIAANIKKNSLLRPYNRSQDIRNLYFVGGSTYPGAGSPIVVLSGNNVADDIIRNDKR
ncbi:phytoene desaturase [Bacillus shivajii]|uniref:phytoene desaturase family protein n=1 Tax=Bacillus shivajii TaxID=1983719 RepID=UPI001CF9C1E8|nr:phytoene desaturase family protein [Bacillus shivajii]UCZ54672.1 phytoene desaturase [Bacillus shivajii]